MPTQEWLKQKFAYGYDSGDVLALQPNWRRWLEEIRIGGSYRQVFLEAVLPHLRPDSTVLELGPGAGSWSRAILAHLPRGRLITVDYGDMAKWLRPEHYAGRLVCHQVTDDSFDVVEDRSIDFFFSFGVLCHNDLARIGLILRNALPKMKAGARAVHQYSDWAKLDEFGWCRGGVPVRFKKKTDDEIWWTRNTSRDMRATAEHAGWEVLADDLKIVRRDGLILLRAPVC